MSRVLTLGAVVLLLLAMAVPAAADPQGQRNFAAPLNGGEENPSVDTHGTGVATFKLNAEGNELAYKVNVANLESVFASHIHCAPVGVNGPVGVTLFMGATDAAHGTLAQGVITDPNPGNACGWEDLSDVVAAMRGGDTYVNVHTVSVPSGEVRGQVK